MKTGFSLMETLVVVLIIGVLISVALPNYFKVVEKARMTEAVMLWGRQKGFITDVSLSQERAGQINEHLSKAPLKYFTAQIICRPGGGDNEKCWEGVFEQKNTAQHVRYRLTTTQNFRNLACSGLNTAGSAFCRSQAQSGAFTLDGYETFLIK